MVHITDKSTQSKIQNTNKNITVTAAVKAKVSVRKKRVLLRGPIVKFYRNKRREYVRKRFHRYERFEQQPSADIFGLVHIRKTKNNTHCSISRLFGNQRTLMTISGGQTPGLGSKSNGRRKSRYCQRMIFKAITEKLLGFGFKFLAIHSIGSSISKRYVFNNFYRKFRIILLKDIICLAHNGCRPPSARKL